MLSAKELLGILRKRGIKNAAVGRVLKLPSSRVAELFGGKRRLQLDEANTLIAAFGIEDEVSPLNGPSARLLVLHAAERLGADVSPEDPEVEELAQDFRAFSEFVASRKVRENVEAFEAFLQGLRAAPGRIGVG